MDAASGHVNRVNARAAVDLQDTVTGLKHAIHFLPDSTALGATKVKLDDSFGYALQAGVDIPVSEKVFLNLDVKYIDIDTKAKLTTGSLVNCVKVSIDPIVVGVGLGIKL